MWSNVKKNKTREGDEEWLRVLFYLGTEKIIGTEGTVAEELQAENVKYRGCEAWSRNSKEASMAGVPW